MADDDISDVLSECSDISYFSDYDLDLEQESQSINFDLSNGSPLETNNFNVVHFNIDSILAEGRLEQSTKMCRILPISVLVITFFFAVAYNSQNKHIYNLQHLQNISN